MVTLRFGQIGSRHFPLLTRWHHPGKVIYHLLFTNVNSSLKKYVFLTVGYHGSGEAGGCGDVLVGSIDQRFHHRISGACCQQPIETYTWTNSSSHHRIICRSEGN